MAWFFLAPRYTFESKKLLHRWRCKPARLLLAKRPQRCLFLNGYWQCLGFNSVWPDRLVCVRTIIMHHEQRMAAFALQHHCLLPVNRHFRDCKAHCSGFVWVALYKNPTFTFYLLGRLEDLTVSAIIDDCSWFVKFETAPLHSIPFNQPLATINLPVQLKFTVKSQQTGTD